MTENVPNSCRVTLSPGASVAYTYEVGAPSPSEANDGRLISSQSASRCSPLVLPGGRFYSPGTDSPTQKAAPIESCPSRQESIVSHVTTTPPERIMKPLKRSPFSPQNTQVSSPAPLRPNDVSVQSFMLSPARSQWISASPELLSHGLSSASPGTPVSSTPRQAHVLAKRGVTTALKEELTCPICLDAYRLPITVPCGHTFCRYCISQGGLYREACPLCRTTLGKTLSINMVLHNLIKTMGFERRSAVARSLSICGDSPRKRKSTASSVAKEGDCIVDSAWWNSKLGKTVVPLQIFLRALMTELKGDTTSLFFDDLLTCVTDYMDTKSLWSPIRLLINFEAAKKFVRSVKISGIDNSAESLEAIQVWVETYVEAKPHTVAMNNSLQPQYPQLAFRIPGDKLHRVDNGSFEGSKIMNKVPWSGGRHACSVIYLPHSSVSLFHFLLVPLTNHGHGPGLNLGLMDIGSTLGTMIKLNQEQQLYDGDVIHLADHLELDIKILDWEASAMYYLSATIEGCFTKGNEVKAWDVVQGRIATVPFSTVFGVPWEPNMPRLETVPQWRLDPNQFVPIPLLRLELRKSQPLTHSAQPSLGSNAENVFVVVQADSEGSVGADVATTTWFVDPSGMAIGRGPTLTAPVGRKIIVTESNGYVSREHCLVYYNGAAGEAPSWKVKDRSSLGTYRKLRAFTDIVPLEYGFVFKIGQCKVEVVEECSSFQNVSLPGNPQRVALPLYTQGFQMPHPVIPLTSQTLHNGPSFYWESTTNNLPLFMPPSATTARFSHETSTNRLRFCPPQAFGRTRTTTTGVPAPGLTVNASITRHSVPPRRLDATPSGLGDRMTTSTTDLEDGAAFAALRSARNRRDFPAELMATTDSPRNGAGVRLTNPTNNRPRGQLGRLLPDAELRTRSPANRLGSAGPSMTFIDSTRVTERPSPTRVAHPASAENTVLYNRPSLYESTVAMAPARPVGDGGLIHGPSPHPQTLNSPSSSFDPPGYIGSSHLRPRSQRPSQPGSAPPISRDLSPTPMRISHPRTNSPSRHMYGRAILARGRQPPPTTTGGAPPGAGGRSATPHVPVSNVTYYYSSSPDMAAAPRQSPTASADPFLVPSNLIRTGHPF
eukprot:Gregarina_sp_Poly_1__10264@NODE_718_length_6629_cov_150_601798_g540_i0_p1_GENE_NODE_718_length_6629_cov_150_601798_g540_i0NODE_718_length_6629_cov_150_601798_g540_i0_p1_ORF_typecomplete_len1112_score138_36zfC3HC4_2/PF13923_6/2_4e10zfRING_UBOX/PF13445_6/6_1e10zfC3HC4_3/PF13920_6/1_2e09zfC3HC4_4/PF15227_6/7_2e09ProkRING_4/PF14447_6/2_7e08FHA/PF00498_26/0_0075FHA/PF00498_26/0_019zfRING_6/PF14835_6/3_7e08zfC3HC4/PF00097_25/1_5e07zfRING_5/PF14634_6/1_4e07zfRING_2/PF13639_6/5_2e07Ubox/PF04564_15/2_2e0